MPAFAPDTAADALRSRLGRPWPLAVLTTAIALAVYAPTVARDLSWAGAATDGGELITASFTLGVPHPPGYPTYVVLGKLFSLLPLGTVAFRYNLFSAVCAALAAGLLAAVIRVHWGERVRPTVAAAAALTFACLPLVWSQAVVAEVYALNLLVVAALVLAWVSRGPVAVVGLLLGLAVTTHPTSLLMLPAALLGTRQGRGRLLAGFALGLLPLLLLPWLARGDSPVVWGRPDTLGGWWWLVSGQLYAANLSLPVRRPLPFDGSRLAALLRALALGPGALVVGRRPAMHSGERRRGGHHRTRSRRTRLIGGGRSLCALRPGLCHVRRGRAAAARAAAAGAAACAGAGAGRASWRWCCRWRWPSLAWSGHTGAAGPSPRALAVAALEAAPPRAVLLTPGDRSLFTLWYFHHVEGLRPDVVLVDANLLPFDWYRSRLAEQQPDLFVPDADDLPAFAQSNARARPVCAVSLAATPPTVLCTEE